MGALAKAETPAAPYNKAPQLLPWGFGLHSVWGTGAGAAWVTAARITRTIDAPKAFMMLDEDRLEFMILRLGHE